MKRLGLIAGLNAKSFLIDLHYALEEEAGLVKVEVKKTAHYADRAEEATRQIQRVLDERVACASDRAVVSWTIEEGVVQVSSSPTTRTSARRRFVSAPLRRRSPAGVPFIHRALACN